MSNINLFPELDNEEGHGYSYNNGHNEHKEKEELIVFGYSCKLFRDDFSAKAIDRGQSLIPWNGDENIMIDRCAKDDFSVSIFLFFTSIHHTIIKENFHKRHLLIIDLFFYEIETKKT